MKVEELVNFESMIFLLYLFAVVVTVVYLMIVL